MESKKPPEKAKDKPRDVFQNDPGEALPAGKYARSSISGIILSPIVELDKMGREIIHLAKDGNSLFESVARQLEDSNFTAQSLRNMVSSMVPGQLERYKTFYEHSIDTDELASKLSDLKKDKSWNTKLGELVIQILADMLRTKIVVVYRHQLPRDFLSDASEASWLHPVVTVYCETSKQYHATKAIDPVKRWKPPPPDTENDGGKTWQDDHGSSTEQLAQMGRVVQPVPPNGNCMFESVSRQLEGASHTHRSLREMLSSLDADDLDRYGEFIDHSDDVADQLDQLKKEGVWNVRLGDLAIRLLADMLGIRILIVSNGQAPVEFCAKAPVQTVVLVYNREEQHYDGTALKPVTVKQEPASHKTDEDRAPTTNLRDLQADVKLPSSKHPLAAPDIFIQSVASEEKPPLSNTQVPPEVTNQEHDNISHAVCTSQQVKPKVGEKQLAVKGDQSVVIQMEKKKSDHAYTPTRVDSIDKMGLQNRLATAISYHVTGRKHSEGKCGEIIDTNKIAESVVSVLMSRGLVGDSPVTDTSEDIETKWNRYVEDIKSADLYRTFGVGYTDPPERKTGGVTSEAETSIHVDARFPKASVSSDNSGDTQFVCDQTKETNFMSKIIGNRRNVGADYRPHLNLETHKYKPWLIHPKSYFRYYWNVFITVSLITYLAVLPVELAFFREDRNTHWKIFNLSNDVVFIMDLLLKLCLTGYLAKESGEVVMRWPTLLRRRLFHTVCDNEYNNNGSCCCSWQCKPKCVSRALTSLLELASSISILAEILDVNQGIGFVKLIRGLKLIRLVRVSRLVKNIKLLQDSGAITLHLRLMNRMLLVILGVHWVGCFQFLVPAWMGFPADTWVVIDNLQDGPKGAQYLAAIFRTFSQLIGIGYGVSSPVNFADTLILLCSMVIGAVFYAMFIGYATDLIQSHSAPGKQFRTHIEKVKEYMAFRRIPKALSSRVISYYDKRYGKKLFDENLILSELSEGLRTEILNHNCRELIGTVPFFSEDNPNFVNAVTKCLKFEMFMPGEIIIKIDSYGDQMYFIESGVVQVQNKEQKTMLELWKGAYFGEIALVNDCKRTATVKAKTLCRLFSLSKEDFYNIARKYPFIKIAMVTTAHLRLKNFGDVEPKKKAKPDVLQTFMKKYDELEKIEMQKHEEESREKRSRAVLQHTEGTDSCCQTPGSFLRTIRKIFNEDRDAVAEVNQLDRSERKKVRVLEHRSSSSNPFLDDILHPEHRRIPLEAFDASIKMMDAAGWAGELSKQENLPQDKHHDANNSCSEGCLVNSTDDRIEFPVHTVTSSELSVPYSKKND